jgi:hypothetical protein
MHRDSCLEPSSTCASVSHGPSVVFTCRRQGSYTDVDDTLSGPGVVLDVTLALKAAASAHRDDPQVEDVSPSGLPMPHCQVEPRQVPHQRRHNQAVMVTTVMSPQRVDWATSRPRSPSPDPEGQDG